MMEESCSDENATRYIESSVLHDGVPQTFVPCELRDELSLELDRLLTEQLLREERKRWSEDTNNIDEGTQSQSDGCLACNGQCKWTPSCDANALAKRRKLLYRELKVVENSNAKTIQSVLARSARSGGEVRFVRQDLLQQLADEIQQIDSQLQLQRIDEELHSTYASTAEFVSVRSIHGYDTTVHRTDAIWALEREHDRHISQMAAAETIDNILEWYDSVCILSNPASTSHIK